MKASRTDEFLEIEMAAYELEVRAEQSSTADQMMLILKHQKYLFTKNMSCHRNPVSFLMALYKEHKNFKSK